MWAISLAHHQGGYKTILADTEEKVKEIAEDWCKRFSNIYNCSSLPYLAKPGKFAKWDVSREVL